MNLAELSGREGALSQAYKRHVAEWNSPDVEYEASFFPCPPSLLTAFRQLLRLRLPRRNQGDEVSDFRTTVVSAIYALALRYENIGKLVAQQEQNFERHA